MNGWIIAGLVGWALIAAYAFAVVTVGSRAGRQLDEYRREREDFIASMTASIFDGINDTDEWGAWRPHDEAGR